MWVYTQSVCWSVCSVLSVPQSFTHNSHSSTYSLCFLFCDVARKESLFMCLDERRTIGINVIRMHRRQRKCTTDARIPNLANQLRGLFVCSLLVDFVLKRFSRIFFNKWGTRIRRLFRHERKSFKRVTGN